MVANKKIIILGGGTVMHVKNHLALCAPAYGTTAKQIAQLCMDSIPKMNTELYLTKMAGGTYIETNNDVENFLKTIIDDLDVKIIFMNAAICDFEGAIDNDDELPGKYSGRLKTSDGFVKMTLNPTNKLLGKIRSTRKDIFLVAFKTTCGATADEQYLAGLKLLKTNSCNMVLANDTKTRLNIIITPEEARYHVTMDREEALKQLVDIAKLRSHLTFTRSTVVDGQPVPWNSDLVYPALRTVVDKCIALGAYKPFMGKTAGHFAVKLSEDTFLTSIRKTDFNELEKNGLVKVTTDGPDNVIAYGAKPSVGGQSQRIVFADHKDREYDCIVHFHCPLKTKKVAIPVGNNGSLVFATEMVPAGDNIPIVSQREFECGSHECGKNTSNGLKACGNLSAVYLDNHGPNIVFNHNIDPQEVINFIEKNFDLTQKTGGLV